MAELRVSGAHPDATGLSLFDGGGELGERMRALDWSKTPLGPVARWPQSLKTCVRIVLTSRQPMFVWWGEDLINLYNDAYKSIVGGKHPAALGQPASVVWREIWDQVGPRAERAMRGNEGTYDEALLLIMERHGYQEETYYTFSYSPVPNERGGTGGILCANSDDTQRIIGERRLAVLRELAARTADARRAEDACAHAAAALATGTRDLPFALIYLAERRLDRRWCWPGPPGSGPVTRRRRSASKAPADSPWPVAEALASHTEQIVDDLSRFRGRPADRRLGAAPDARVVVWPLTPSGADGTRGRAGRGLEPISPVRRRLPQVRLAGRRSDLRGRRQRGSVRGRTAPCRSARRDRSREDRLLLERQPRVPDAAHADAGAARGRAGVARRRAARREPEGRPPQHAAPLAVGQQPARLLADRSRARQGSLRADGSGDADRRPGQRVSFGHRTGRVGVRGRLPAAAAAGVRRPRDVGDDRPQPAVERLQVHDEGERSRRAARRATGGPSCGSATPASASRRASCRACSIASTASRCPEARTYEGSGIGLALVKELVQLHGGHITVTSQEGTGTAFTVSIPLGRAHLPPDRIGAGQESGRAAAPATRAEPFVQEALRWMDGSGSDGQGVTEGVVAAADRGGGAAGRPRPHRRRQRRHAGVPGAPARPALAGRGGQRRRARAGGGATAASRPDPDGRHDAEAGRLRPAA